MGFHFCLVNGEKRATEGIAYGPKIVLFIFKKIQKQDSMFKNVPIRGLIVWVSQGTVAIHHQLYATQDSFH